VQAAVSVVKAFRTHGHLAAKLDPLGSEPEGDPALDPETVGLTPELLGKIPAKILRIHVPGATIADALPHLRETYCGTIAYEIEHISSHRQRTWLRQKIESGEFRKPLTNDESRWLLNRLTKVDSLERFMHKAYLGQKQFSIEGLDVTVPMLDETIQLAAANGAREVVIGMAHRGRLNVLAHNLGRPYESIFREFEGASDIEAVTTIPQGGTGRRQVPPRRPGHLPAGRCGQVDPRPPGVQPLAPRVRRPGGHGRHPRGADERQARTPIRTRARRPRPAARRTRPSPARASSPRRSTCRRSTATRSAAVHLIQNNQVGFTTEPTTRARRGGPSTWHGLRLPDHPRQRRRPAACISAVRCLRVPQEFGTTSSSTSSATAARPQRGRRAAYTQRRCTARSRAKKRVA
jgi:2-oxoglutarate dehydrogenase E1 component